MISSNPVTPQDSVFVERMFAIFDKNGDGSINFHEFISGLSVFCSDATLEEKMRCVFSSPCTSHPPPSFLQRV
jgi:Ca2+-binding EF-hand superfamily protein